MRGKRGRHPHLLDAPPWICICICLLLPTWYNEWHVPALSKAQLLHLDSESVPYPLSNILLLFPLLLWDLFFSLGSVPKYTNMLLYLLKFFPCPICPSSYYSISQRTHHRLTCLRSCLGKPFYMLQPISWHAISFLSHSFHVFILWPKVISVVMILYYAQKSPPLSML